MGKSREGMGGREESIPAEEWQDNIGKGVNLMNSD